MKSDVKQGDITAPTLFTIYFAMVFNTIFGECSNGIYISYQMSGNLFNIRCFAANTKVFITLVWDLLYADDCNLMTQIEQAMQHLMNTISWACMILGLTINLKKIIVMYQPAPAKIYVEPNIYVYGWYCDVLQLPW